MHAIQRSWSRLKTLVSYICSTSPRLSAEIRSQAPPAPPFYLPLHLPLSLFFVLAPYFIPLFSSFPLLPHLISHRCFLSLCICPHPSLVAFHPSLSFCLHILLFSLYAHICDQIMWHIMGLVSLMVCIKMGELRDR